MSLEGSRRSPAMSAATKAIQAMLITPRAKSAAISAQQHAMQCTPCSSPLRAARGSRQRRRHASLTGVTWNSAAARMAPPAT
jgi:hypothetical protein